MRWLVLIVVLVGVTACGKKPPVVAPPIVQTVEVKVPVPTKMAPPAELLTQLTPPLPVFVPPEDPKATSALTPEGERMLRGLIEQLLAQIAAWKAWATTP